jgi:putative zinc finger protein
MLCEHANPLLIEYATGELPAEEQQRVAAHLTDCAACQAEYAAVEHWQSMANNWQDEVVPQWHPAPMPKKDWYENFRVWFPTAASTAALAMATLMYVQLPQTTGALPNPVNTPANYEHLPPLPQATQAAMVERVMEGSREQRAEELQALLKILKAEMDRRSIETEESLRFVITSQLQGQQELDALYKQVEDLMEHPQPANTLTGSSNTVDKSTSDGVTNR